MRSLIGIPPCLDDRGRWRAGRVTHYADAAYAACVESCGGAAVYLPPGEKPEAQLEHLDGLLIPGGGDFAPPRAYPPAVRFDLVPETQLACDRRLLAGALERELPVLAICYGMQLLVLHCGGSLHYDLASDRPGSGEHRLPEPDARHGLALEPGTRIRHALGTGSLGVNSSHHQGVAEAGPSLRVGARADDGLIEAVELPGASWCVGVQWHPERMRGGHAERLFESFVRACDERRRS
jgi:putative glutamine amidotransferase